MKLQDRVALRIRTIRKRRGITQEELAERIDRTADAVSQLERGVSLPSFATLERLAGALEVPVRDFFDTQEDDGTTPRRNAQITALLDVAHGLSDRELDTAVEVLEAIARKRRRRKSGAYLSSVLPAPTRSFAIHEPRSKK